MRGPFVLFFLFAAVVVVGGFAFFVWLGRGARKQAEEDERDPKKVRWFPNWPTHPGGPTP